MEDDYAVVVGINKYPEDPMGPTPLGAAVLDAEKVLKWLQEEAKVPSANCRWVKNNIETEPIEPVKGAIDFAFSKIIRFILEKKNCKARRFYFYFAGHGMGLYRKKTDIALCLANWNQINIHDALSLESYLEMITSCGFFSEAIFLADCCRNIGVNIKPESPVMELPSTGPYVKTSKYLIGYACQYTDQSFEDFLGSTESSMEKRGIFTEVLLEAFNGAAADETGSVSVESLRTFVEKEVPIRANERGFKQESEVLGSFADSYKLFEKKIDGIGQIQCNILFAPGQTGVFKLINGKGDVVTTIDAELTPTFTINLPRTQLLYLITGEMPFKNVDFTTYPDKTVIDVNCQF
jgi:Caspase domain